MRVIVLTLGLLVAPLAAEDGELDDILRRFDSQAAGECEAAQAELDRWCVETGTSAADELRARSETATADERARIEGQIAFLASVEDCRRTVSLFGDLGWPDVRGKTLARFNTGEVFRWSRPEDPRFLYEVGWVLDESPDEVTLLLDRLATVTRKRDRTRPHGWSRRKDRHPSAMPLPGEVAPVDFAKVCDLLLANPRPSYTLERLIEDDQGALPGFARAALFAWWALQLGRPRTAVALTDLAESARPKATDPLPKALARTVTSTLRWIAMTGANHGEPRKKLVSQWRQLASLSWSDAREEAKQMADLYGDLLEEDRTWRALSREEIASLDKKSQVAFWMHAVRDLGAKQWSQPGECILMGPLSGLERGVANPAEELLHIGWAALPEVIAHLDDAHPTRSLGFCREQWWDTYWVLRYGDVCRTIYEGITGETLYTRSSTSGYMVSDGKAPDAKQAALKWWGEHRDGGPDAYYGAMFDGPDRGAHRFAAIKLLREDAARHLPRILEKAKTSDEANRARLLDVMLPHLGPEHREFLEGFLEGNDWGASYDAALALHERCGTDSGILRLLERVEGGDEAHVSAGGVVRLLGRLEGTRGADVVCRWATRETGIRRYEALHHGHYVADPIVAEALVLALDNKSNVGGPNTYRHCDYAADSLAKLIDRTALFDMFQEGEVGDRDAAISELRAWWIENKESLDWNSLRELSARRRSR